MTTDSSRGSPWYREPLVWLVLAIPAAAVLAGAVMLVLANVTWDGLVADDYYRQGLQINRSLARDAEAARLGLEAVVAFPAPGGGGGADHRRGRRRRGTTRRSAAPSVCPRGTGGADVRVLLTRDDSGVWRGVLPEMAPGKWYVDLGNARWRLAAPAWMPASKGGLVRHAPAGSDRR